MRVLVTGASGWVGGAVCQVLRQHGHGVRRALRSGQGDDAVIVGEVNGATDWSRALADIDAVIHCAAVTLAEGRHDGPDARRAFAVNRDGSAALAKAAAGRVQRFIQVSTIKVLGETSSAPLREDAPLAPFDAYAASKAAAEQAVIEALAGSASVWVILRPPLVFGPERGRGANFHRLAMLARSGLPLPVQGASNRRSLIFIDNLAQAIVAALSVPPGVYHLADRPALSIADWVRLAARVQGQRAWLIPGPIGLMSAALTGIGRGGIAQRLFGSLEVDTTRAEAVFPPPHYSLEEGFARSLAAGRAPKSADPTRT